MSAIPGRIWIVVEVNANILAPPKEKWVARIVGDVVDGGPLRCHGESAPEALGALTRTLQDLMAKESPTLPR